MGLKGLGSAGATTENLFGKIRIIVEEEWRLLWTNYLGGTGDGAANIKAVWKKIKSELARWAVSRHCGAHRLQLSASGALAEVPELTQVKKSAHAIVAIAHASGKRRALFHDMQKKEKFVCISWNI
jgi:hypothetical protein